MDWTKKFPYEKNFAEKYYDSREDRISREACPEILRREYNEETVGILHQLAMDRLTDKLVAKGRLSEIKLLKRRTPLRNKRINDLIAEIAENKSFNDYPDPFTLYQQNRYVVSLHLTWQYGKTGHRFQIIDLDKIDEEPIRKSVETLKFVGKVGPQLYAFSLGNLWSAYKTKSNLAVLKYHYGLYI